MVGVGIAAHAKCRLGARRLRLRGALREEWEREGELTSSSYDAPNRDGSLVRFDDPPGHVQPQSQPLDLLPLCAAPEEPLAELLLILGRDADALVANADDQRVPHVTGGDGDLPTVRRIFDGIAHQVVHDLLEA